MALRVRFTPTSPKEGEFGLLDTVVIGGGPAGLGAAMYAARFRLKTILITSEVGGQLNKAGWVEDYLGFTRIMGPELAGRFEDHVRHYDVPILLGTVAKVERGELFRVITDSGDEYLTRTVIVAVGERRRKLGVPGEEEYSGRGVSYCAPCDAPLFKNMVTAVVGGGDSAAQAALLLSEYSTKVYLIHRRNSLRAQPHYQELIARNNKIEILWNTVVRELRGDKVLRSALVENLVSGETKELALDGLFIEIGSEPPREFLEGLGVELVDGYVKVNENMETSVPGIFAAGDCVTLTPKGFRQIIIAAAQGAVAAYSAYQYILRKYGQER